MWQPRCPELPQEVLEVVFGFLDVTSLARAAQVSRGWSCVPWRKICIRDPRLCNRVTDDVLRCLVAKHPKYLEMHSCRNLTISGIQSLNDLCRIEVVNLRTKATDDQIVRGIMAIAPRLRELSLSGTLVSTAAALQLVCDLEKDGAGSSLCRINLAGPPRFAGHTAVKGFGDVGARSLAAWAGDAGLSPRLTSLNVALNNIGPVGAAAFGRALKDNNRLQAFCIADNTIFHTRDFEAPLRGNVSLTHLDLSRCGIYSTGVQGLARGLSGNRTLRVLLLRANSLESAGACLIADTIHETALRRIDLASNGIYGEGARALAAAIATNVTLKDVDLDHNKMCEAAREMADALTKNHTLHTIHLAQNDFLGRVAAELSQGLRGNTTLKRLHIDHDQVWEWRGREQQAGVIDHAARDGSEACVTRGKFYWD